MAQMKSRVPPNVGPKAGYLLKFPRNAVKTTRKVMKEKVCTTRPARRIWLAVVEFL
jgi:hypothetical protein